MRRSLWLLVAFLLPALAFSQNQQTSTTDPQQPTFATPRASQYAADSVLVRYRPEASPTVEARTNATRGVIVSSSYATIPGLRLLKLPPTLTVAQAIRVYSADPDVLYAEPNYKVWATDKKPNDPMFSTQWAYLNIGDNGGVAGADIKATKAWDLTTGDSSVVIGIIDSGVQSSHPDLAANLMTPVTFMTGSTPEDQNGHGTHVAGTIGAVGNNALGVTGVNWNVSMLACRFLDENGSGDTSDAVACLDYLATQKDQGLNLIATSNSWGGIGYSQALYDAIRAHLDRGILFFAAAGNGDAYGKGVDTDQFPHYPSSYDLDNIVSVAATDRTDSLASFSNFGLHSAHLGAPGVGILSTLPDWAGSYGTASGTSMATPHVSGAAALLKAWNPNLRWWQIRNLLLAGGDTIPALAKTISGNRLNVYGSMTCSGRTVSMRTSPRRNIVTTVVGGSVKLKTLNISCDQPAGAVNITGPSGETIVLHDDGLDGDDAAGDGIYTYNWIATAPGNYPFTFPGADVVTVKVLRVYGFANGTQNNYVNFTGTNLNIKDEGLATIASPFPVRFGGQTFNTLYVSDNGYLSLESQESVGLGLPIPAPSFGTVVAPFWFDFNPKVGTNNNVFWGVTGSAPNRQLVVEWRDVPPYPFTSADGTVRFQTVLNESSDDVIFNYSDVNFGGSTSIADAGRYASVGVQSTADWGTQYSWYQSSLTNGLSLVWTTRDPDFQLGTTTNSQTVFLGQTGTFTHTLTALYGFEGDVTVSCSTTSPASCTPASNNVPALPRGSQIPITAQSDTVGSYSVSVQAQGPAQLPITKTSTVTLNVVDFSLGTPSLTTLTIPNGGSGSFTVPVSFVPPITTPASLTCVGLPTAATCSFSPSDSILPSTTPTQVTVTVQLAPQTTTGDYALQVVATEPGAPYNRTQNLTLTVQPNPDFFLTTSTPVIYGTSASGTVTAKQQDSYTGSVAMTCAVEPAGPACSLSPQNLSTFPTEVGVSVSLGTAPAGNYTVTVTGNDGKISHTVSLTYLVADFVPTVASGTIVYGSTQTAVSYALTALNGYTGTIVISCDASSMGVNSYCFPNYSPITLQGQTTFNSSLYVSPGNGTSWSGSYPVAVTFTDTGNRISHTVVASVTPETFTFEPDSTDIPAIYPGQMTAPVPYTITPINGFSQTINIQPNCSSCTFSPSVVTPALDPVHVNLTVTAPVVANPTDISSKIQFTPWATVNLPSYNIVIVPKTLLTVFVKDFGFTSSLPGIWTPTLDLMRGSNNSFQLKYNSFNGYDQSIEIACPTLVGVGLHCSVDKTELLPNDSATFTFSADPDVIVSSRSLDIQGTSTLPDGSPLTHTFTLTLNVTNIEVSLTPTTMTVPAGGTANFQLNATSPLYPGSPATASCTTIDPGVTCTAPLTLWFLNPVNVQVTTTDGVTSVGPHNFTVTVSDFNSSVSVTGTIVMQGHDSIILTSPNGNEAWPSGVQNITWNYTGDPGSTVKLELLKNGVLDRLIADNVPVGNTGVGSYSWTIPDTLPFSQYYQVRITSDSRTDITDESDLPAVMGKGLAFTQPNADTVVFQGDYIRIEYYWAGNGNIDFDLYKGGKFFKQLQHGYPSGYYNWCPCWGSIGYTGTDTPPGNDYTVVGTPVGEPSHAATSKSFTIGTGAINITYPKGGEIWHPGETQTVTWTWNANYVNPSHEMSLKLETGYDTRNITLSTDLGANGSGSYTFTVPQDAPASTYYRVVAQTYGTPSISGGSAQTFAVGNYHTLSVQISGNGYVTSSDYLVNCSNACSYYYNNGATVTLQASSANFGGWEGGGCSGTGTCTVTLNSDVVVKATFTQADIAFTTVGAAPPPFKSGTSAQFQLSLASTPGFTSTTVLTCSSLPAYSSCTFDQNNLSLTPTPTVVTVTLHTTGTNGVLSQKWRSILFRFGSFAFLGLFCFFGRFKRNRTLLGILLLAVAMQFVACGGGGSTGGGGGGGTVGTPPGNYQITVTATGGSITRTVTVPITVQ